MARPLTDFTDVELRDALRQISDHVVYAYVDIEREMERRSRYRLARASIVLSVVGLVIAVAAIVISAAKG